jgi:hypothetical protein
MMFHGSTPSKHEPCLFVKTEETGPVYVMVHVDDALVIGHYSAVSRAKQLAQSMFEIKDMGKARKKEVYLPWNEDYQACRSLER